MTMKTTAKLTKTKKNQEKIARINCRSHLNQKLFSENFIIDPLNVFFKPMGAVNYWITCYWVESNR